MAIKILNVSFTNFSRRGTFRADFRFSHYYEKPLPYRNVAFKEFILKIRNGKDIPTDYYVDSKDTTVIYPTVNNIKPTGLVLDDVIGISSDFQGGYYIDTHDIVITRSGTVGITKSWDKTIVNATMGTSVQAIPSGYLIVVKIDKNAVNPIFIENFLNSKTMSQYFNVFGVGKSQRNIAQEDIRYIPLPSIAKADQDQIVESIKPIQDQIDDMRSQIIPAQEIINKIFSKKFNTDQKLYQNYGKGMSASTQRLPNKRIRIFATEFSQLSKGNMLRSSTRFHNPPTTVLMDTLKSIDTIAANEIIQSCEKGIQPKYDINGDVPVVKIGNLKNSYIDFTNSEMISQKTYDQLDDKKKLKYGDIILCATGKGSLGKIDYYSYRKEAITAIDNYILRLSNYNPKFFVYFFRSILGYFQFERDYTGATNQIHLYWDQISQLRIPDITLDEQQRVVDEIDKELSKQDVLTTKIEQRRMDIDKIINQALGSRGLAV